MYWLVEDTEQLKVFYNSGFKEAYIEIISNNDSIHPAINDLCAVYIRPIGASKGFMLCINHSEAINVKKDWVFKILSKFETLYCKDKKLILHYFVLPNLEDILLPPQTLDLKHIPVYGLFNQKYRSENNVNQLIPIVKHYEWCENIYNAVKPLIQQEKTQYYEFYNNKVSVVFNAIERAGIGVNTELFTDYFYPISTNKVYTQYNLNTTTTRPSNKFNGVNYAALNHKTGERESFIPKNDKLVEFDAVAMHPYCAAHLVHWTFTSVDPYMDFGEYCGKTRDEAKILMFAQLYGYVDAKYANYPFFAKLSTYINNLWESYNNEGFVKNPISGYEFNKKTHNILKKNTLFNYMLQSVESAIFTIILYNMLKNMRGLQSKITLYTYDSILFDIDDNEESLINQQISDEFAAFNLQIKQSSGKDYNSLL